MSSAPGNASCRACLVQRRSLRPLFQRVSAASGSLTYADLLRSIANVKIQASDGNSDKICITCRRKAEEAYEFKTLVEQSDKQLWIDHKYVNDTTKPTRKLTFDNVAEIKVEIEGCKLENASKNDPDNVGKWEFKKGAERIFYNNTSIKRMAKTETAERMIMKNEINVEDFFKAIVKNEITDVNDEIDEENFYEDDWIGRADDDEYLPPSEVKKLSVGKTKHKKKKKSLKGEKKSKSKDEINTATEKKCRLEPILCEDICLSNSEEKGDVKSLLMKKGMTKIKPVILNDYRLVPTYSGFKHRKPRHKKGYKSQKCICPYCGLITANMKTHIRLHTGERNYKCDECPKAFFTSKMLETHKIKHSGQRNYKCDKCSASFYVKGSLKGHMRCHQDVKDLLCKICSKGFKRKSGLRRHELRHSLANKTIKCEICEMTFFEPCFLRHHMRVHTGERPFRCDLCSQPYSYGRDFIRHCLKKHGCRFKGSEVRVMNEEVLQRERARAKEAVDRQRSAEAVQSIFPLPVVGENAAAITSHQLELQLKILNGELR